MSQRLSRSALCLCGLVALWAASQGQAFAASTRAAQKNAAEAQRSELRQKLDTLKAEIGKTETAKDQASDALAESEEAISKAKRSLRDLQEEQTAAQARLDQLEQERQRLSDQVDTQKKRLSDFLRRQYMRGSNDRIKLLLSGDDPNRINRDLQYMGYVSQTQAKMIDSLRASLAAVEQNAEDERDTKQDLDDIAQEQLQHKTALEQEKQKRSKLLSQLADKLHAQKKQADNLQKDEQRLSALVTKLNKLIEEQIKAEQARAAQLEKQRQEKLALQKAQREKAGKTGAAKPAPEPAEEAPKAIAKNELTPVPGTANGEFARLKGQLHLPVKGELIARFGNKRADGPTWKGLFIRAAEGAEVKAIATGKVVFAQWLKGFGNLIIVDHGSEYISIYGNNQSVLKHVGDIVKTGETIANAGNSGGNEESGLYFEIRHQGQVVDPMQWVGKLQ